MAQFIDPKEPIAVIGIGGVFPGAKTIPEYWANITGGTNSIIEVPQDRWDWRLYYSEDRSAPDKTYSKIGGFLLDYDFDPLKLRIPPPVAEQMDAVQKIAVAATAEALKDSGYDQKPYDRERTAVILGNSMGGTKKEATDLRVYSSLYRSKLAKSASFGKLPASARQAIEEEFETSIKADLCAINEDSMPGELSNVIAGRVANVFNLNGPNFTVDAACAASLGAISQAVNGLRFRQFDMAVSGGADQMMAPPAYVKFCKIGALSPDGSRPFDAGANGFVMGEGAGVVVLKRLSDALRDGDRIYALIRSIGASSDGRGKGITAPNPKGQKLAMRRCFEQLDYGPADVGLLEAHGTATKVGDVVEVQSASEIFKDAPAGSIALGSVKSQIGHLKSAAGAASLVKTVLAIHRKTLPPSINFKTPNPGIDWKSCPFYVSTEARPWEAGPKPRRANVSAFGFGGTNFHVALEEATPETTSWTPSLAALSQQDVPRAEAARPAREFPPAAGAEAFLVRGTDPGSVLNRLKRLKEELPEAGPLTALAHRVSTETGGHVLGIAAESAQKLAEKIDLVVKTSGPDIWRKVPPSFRPKGIHPGKAAAKKPKVAFLFPGQGSQYVDMLKDLCAKYQVAADTFAEADAIMKELIGEPLTGILFTQGGETPEELAAKQERIKQTEITQPAVLTADVALLRLLRLYGVEPDVVAGHSLGEYGALVASGMLDFKDALLAVSARGKEMANVKVEDNGKMASISASVEKVEPVLKKAAGYVIAANKNCPAQTVIAGASAAVEEAVKLFQAEGVQAQLIEVSHAFHSGIVAPATKPYTRCLEGLDIRSPKVPILSNVTADYYPGDVKAILKLMAAQISSPVEFIRQIERMYADGVRVFVEVGPKRALTAFVTSTLEGREGVCAVPSNHPKRGGIQEFNDMLARLAASGVPLDLSKTDPAAKDSLYTREYASWACSRPSPAGRDRALSGGQVLPLPRGEGRGEGASQDLLDKWDIYLGPVVVSGISGGVPGRSDRVFREDALDCIIDGQNLIDLVPEEELKKQLDKNLERLMKSDTGAHSLERLESVEQVLRLAGQAGRFDMSQEFGVRGSVSSLMDITAKLSLAAGILALKDAGIPLVRHYKRSTTGKLIPTAWSLPDEVAEGTGVILASAFPGLDSLIDDLSRYFASRYAGKPRREVEELYDKMLGLVKDPGDRRQLTEWYVDFRKRNDPAGGEPETYHFSRSFLFRVLSLGHAQAAQFLHAKGPCTQVNAACASTTQAVGIAEDWIRTGRAKRVLVLAADDITNPTSFPWLGTGFLAAGAATTHNVVSEAALPFDRRRNGMIVGMGAAALVIEDGREVAQRGMKPLAEVLATQFENSAYHVTRLNTRHVSETMERLLRKAERRHGLSRREIAPKMLFMSHETYTPAQGGSSAAEVEALKFVFREDTSKVVVTNTKGFTGHSMGASLEDVIAIRAMNRGKLPPIANYKEPDPHLTGITLSHGEEGNYEFALRLGAGFGSQIAMTLTRRTYKLSEPRVADPGRYQAWLSETAQIPNPELEVEHNTLRIKDVGPVDRTQKRQPTSTPHPTPLPVGEGETRPQNNARRLPAGEARGKLDEDTVRKEILALVSEKTGYPPEMLELDLDMEADLGIDTVKQAELIGLIREKYAIPRQENLSLKDYPTLRHVIRFVLTGGGAPSTAAAPAPAAVSQPAPVQASAPARSPGLGEDQVRKEILALVSEKTGYPPEMLELDLDMEADLGIDTVKQAELIGLIREKYAIPRQENLSLKDYPTLRHVIKFVLSGSGGTPAPQTPAVQAAPAPTHANGHSHTHVKPPPPSARGGLDEEAVKKEILAVVSEKTGYPPEMLDLDLDMEADLGIDTVKQAELIGLIREKYAIPRQENLSLKDYPTLRHVIGFVMKAPLTPDPLPSGEGETQPPEQSATSPRGADARYGTWRLEAYPRPAPGKAPAFSKEKAVLILAADPADAEPFAKAVEEAGGQAALLKAADWADSAEAAKAAREALKERKVQGLLDLTGWQDAAAFDKLTPASFDRAYRRSARAAFLVAQALREDLLAAKESWVLALTRMDGRHGAGGEGKFSPLAGLQTGLAKALSRELEGVRTAAVDFDAATPLPDAARLALAELGSEDPRLEVGFAEGERHALRLVPQDLDEEPARKVGHHSVFLVTGGGQGLGAELSKEIARRWRCRLVLLGRTELAKEAVSWARMTDQELADFKKRMWEDLKSDKSRKATPAILEREFSKVRKAIDLQRNIEEMIRLGAKVLYLAADMADGPAVAKAVKKALREFDTVDFVVHAAGLEESKLLADKKPESFDRIVRAKAHGAFHLLKALPRGRNQTWAFFSSVVARFGNVGQTDYAAANDFLAKLAFQLSRSGTRAMTFDLTAFSEIGMATRGGVEMFLKSQGVDFLDPKTGIDMLLEQLLRNPGDCEVLVAGALGKLDSEGLISARLPHGETSRFVQGAEFLPLPSGEGRGEGRVATLPATRVFFDKVLSQEACSVVTEKTFSLESDPWLKDHSIAGTPWVAGVMGLELFAQTAARLAGEHPAGLQDVRFALPIKLLRNRPAAVRAIARQGSEGAELVLESDFITPQGIKLGAPRTHFTARTLGKALGWGGMPKPQVPGGREWAVKASDIYEAYFHGPSFQVLEGLLALSESELLAVYKRPAKPLWEAAAPVLAFQPLLIEAAFQACGYRDHRFLKKMTLPDSIGAAQVLRREEAPERLYVYARYQGSPEAGKSSYDAWVFDDDYGLWAVLKDYRMIVAG